MSQHFDVAVIGSGPAGLSAAVEAAELGRKVVLIEKAAALGGACVHHGTIPSKTLRETTAAINGFRRKSGDVIPLVLPEGQTVAGLMARKDQVVRAHERFIAEQVSRAGVHHLHGRARFLDARRLGIRRLGGQEEEISADLIVLAVGSRPRSPPGVPIDHEVVLDSDSILSLIYLPHSLTVLGGGVIACEYASIFAALGVKVTMIDRGERPLAFLDAELSQRFVACLEGMGGRFLGKRALAGVSFDGLAVTTRTESGEEVASEKMLAALGRVAAVDGLELAAAGLAPDSRGLLAVDGRYRTAVPHILGVGDVIGPPSLAAAGQEQGRRAIRHAFDQPLAHAVELIPIGIYSVPEISSVGLSEAEARARPEGVTVGRASFQEIARGHISAVEEGFLKLVADGSGRRLLGVQIIGDGATELVHLGQMALLQGAPVDLFVENVFNFPTLAEAYRVAALDIIRQRRA